MSYFRHPRTTQERRAAHAHADEAKALLELGVNVRAPRPRRGLSVASLPSRLDRNWKRFRQSQCHRSA
jgi:hypothetical protein